jgi:hypothetical protein
MGGRGNILGWDGEVNKAFVANGRELASGSLASFGPATEYGIL